MNKKLVVGIIIVILIVVGFGIYRGLVRDEEPVFTTVKVARGDIRQEISEIGVIKTEEIDLNFKKSGRVEKIFVEVGQEIKKGDILARLEDESLKIQLEEAKLSLDLVKNTKVGSEIALLTAERNLEDTRDITKENLKSAYENALNILRSSNLKLENAFNMVDSIQKKYFFINDQEGIRVRENRDRIKDIFNRGKNYLDIAKINPTEENTDIALSKMREALETTLESLTFIQDINRGARYRYVVSSASKVALDNERARIITALTGIINSQQAISSIRINSEAKINKAESQILIEETRARDIKIKKDQAENKIQLLENQIQEANLYSPVDGKITNIDKKEGEIFMPGVEPFVSLISDIPFQIETSIEVSIHEEDIILIEVGNSVEIEIFAFPDQIFRGKVVSIKPTLDPAKKTAMGMVFYQVIIDFQEGTPKGLKPEMTGDVVIITALRQDVLIIPEDAIFEKGGIKMVQVLKNDLIRNREIEIGFIGDDDIVEILSGLNEGEEIIKNPKDF